MGLSGNRPREEWKLGWRSRGKVNVHTNTPLNVAEEARPLEFASHSVARSLRGVGAIAQKFRVQGPPTTIYKG